MFIGVIGGRNCSENEVKIAEEIGREIAKRKAILICGGLGGVMEAACKGAYLEGGRTVGILPGRNPKSANPYVEIPIATGMGEARNVIIIRSSQAVIAIDGEFGTLSEIAFALRQGVPIVGLNTWRLLKDGQEDETIIRASNPKEAVEKAFAAAISKKNLGGNNDEN